MVRNEHEAPPSTDRHRELTSSIAGELVTPTRSISECLKVRCRRKIIQSPPQTVSSSLSKLSNRTTLFVAEPCDPSVV